jgi:hypothetical protein
VPAERALEAVLDVLRGDLAIDRGRELDPLLELDRDDLLVGGDLRLAVGDVRARLLVVAGSVGVQPAVDRVMDHVAEGVVGLTWIDIVHVAGGQRGQMTALLALPGRGAVEVALGGAGLRSRAARVGAGAGVAAAGGDTQAQTRCHQQRKNT